MEPDSSNITGKVVRSQSQSVEHVIRWDYLAIAIVAYLALKLIARWVGDEDNRDSLNELAR